MNNKKKLVLVVGIIIVAVIAAVVLMNVLGVFKPAPVKAVEKYLLAVPEGDAKTMTELSAEPADIKWLVEEGHIKDEEELIAKNQELVERTVASYKESYGDNYKVSFKNMEVYKEYSKEDVEKLGTALERHDGKYGFKKEDLKEVVIVKGTRVVKSGKGEVESEMPDMVVKKVKNKWYFGDVHGLIDEEQIDEFLKAN